MKSRSFSNTLEFFLLMQYTLPLPLISGTVVQKSNALIGGRKKMEGYRNRYLKENLYFKMVITTCVF
jgi:hypothetical protein